MSKKMPPKKPLTAFFLFKEKMKKDGVKLAGKEAGKRWNSLSDSEKKPYLDEYKKKKEEYNLYLEKYEGIKPKSPGKRGEKPTCYRPSKIRVICGSRKEIKDMSSKLCAGLCKVLVIVSSSSHRNS